MSFATKERTGAATLFRDLAREDELHFLLDPGVRVTQCVSQGLAYCCAVRVWGQARQNLVCKLSVGVLCERGKSGQRLIAERVQNEQCAVGCRVIGPRGENGELWYHWRCGRPEHPQDGLSVASTHDFPMDESLEWTRARQPTGQLDVQFEYGALLWVKGETLKQKREVVRSEGEDGLLLLRMVLARQPLVHSGSLVRWFAGKQSECCGHKNYRRHREYDGEPLNTVASCHCGNVA
jgi:hypothetical protein